MVQPGSTAEARLSHLVTLKKKKYPKDTCYSNRLGLPGLNSSQFTRYQLKIIYLYLTLCFHLLVFIVGEFISQGAISGLPEELSSRGAHFDEPAGQALALYHGGHRGQTVPLYQAAGHACRGAALPGWYDDAQAVMPAATHGPASGVHHEANQEAEGGEQEILASEKVSSSALLVLRVSTPKIRFDSGGFL